MGFLICRVMRTYGMPYRELMSLPMRVFWHLSGTVPRLIAGERKEMVELLVAAHHNPQEAMGLYERLDQQAPDPVKLTTAAVVEASSIRDVDGLNALRNM